MQGYIMGFATLELLIEAIADCAQNIEVNSEKNHKELVAILNRLNLSLPMSIKINNTTYNLVFNINNTHDIPCYYDTESIKLSNIEKSRIINSINDDWAFVRAIIPKICAHFRILNYQHVVLRHIEGREYNFILIEREDKITINQLNCLIDFQTIH